MVVLSMHLSAFVWFRFCWVIRKIVVQDRSENSASPGVALITWPSTFHLLGWRSSSVKFQLEKHMNQDIAVWVGLSLASAMPKVKQGEIARMEVEDACVYSSRWLCPLSQGHVVFPWWEEDTTNKTILVMCSDCFMPKCVEVFQRCLWILRQSQICMKLMRWSTFCAILSNIAADDWFFGLRTRQEKNLPARNNEERSLF